MGRHTLRTRPTPSPRPRPPGHVMLGGVADPDDTRRWSHWVPLGSDTVRYQYGKAWRAACGALCVPAGDKYLTALQACPECDRHERGFVHRIQPTYCVEQVPRSD